MIIVKVTYTVNPDFVARNQSNVQKFMEDVRNLNNPGIKYYSFLGPDGKTFTHLALYENEEAQKQFLDIPSFRSFQQQRNASGLEQEEHIEVLELVASA